ncbi:MAG: hypothetical protein J6K48_03825 [Lachnospiraceae bacterium]|nr:hypothetical protein [Lachnospiraceae bacterium]
MALFDCNVYLSKYAAVCHFRRQARRFDNGNYLESWELRGSMRVAE